MAAIVAIIVAATAGVAFAVTTIIVIIGIRREERYLTLENRQAPTATARLARIVLGRYVRNEYDAWAGHGHLDDYIGQRDHDTISRV